MPFIHSIAQNHIIILRKQITLFEENKITLLLCNYFNLPSAYKTPLSWLVFRWLCCFNVTQVYIG